MTDRQSNSNGERGRMEIERKRDNQIKREQRSKVHSTDEDEHEEDSRIQGFFSFSLSLPVLYHWSLREPGKEEGDEGKRD